MQDGYFSALELIEKPIADILRKVSQDVAKRVEEIRLRAERPVSVCFSGKIYFVNENSYISEAPKGAVRVEKAALNSTVRNICGSSIYSHTDEIMNGFISMPHGNRAGIVGSFRQGKFCDVSSVNIRIARECRGIADTQIGQYTGGSLLICGPPGCGKTTFLRELVRGISNGECGKPYKISVIDTRNEIAAAFGGVPQLEVGVNTDVISGRDKAQGIEAALRSMSPEIIAFDEIGTLCELEAVGNSLSGGAYIITTAHIESPEKLACRSVTRRLLAEGSVDKVIFLKKVGASPVIFSVREGKICGL